MSNTFGFMDVDSVKQIYSMVRSILSFLAGPRKGLPGLALILVSLVAALVMLAPWLNRMMQPTDACSVYSLRHKMTRDVLANGDVPLGSTPGSEQHLAQIMLLKAAGGSTYRVSIGQQSGKGEVSSLWISDPLLLDPFATVSPQVDNKWPQLKLLGLKPDSSTVHILFTDGQFAPDASERKLPTDDVELAYCVAQDRQGRVKAVKDKLLVGTVRDLALENAWNLGSLALAAGFLGFSLIEFVRWLEDKRKNLVIDTSSLCSSSTL